MFLKFDYKRRCFVIFIRFIKISLKFINFAKNILYDKIFVKNNSLIGNKFV